MPAANITSNFSLAAATSGGEYRLLLLRYLMIALGGLVLALALALGVQLPWLLCAAALALLLAANLLLHSGALDGYGMRLQVLLGLYCDVLALSALLFVSGGAANPLSSLYLPPVLFAALLFPGRQPWLLGLLALLCYGLLFVWHLPWPLTGVDSAYAFSLHLIGMWLTLALSMALIVTFVSHLSRRLSRREHELAQARETQLQNEQMVALGVQAAMAAHSLSTPLSTLTLLVDELAATTTADDALAADLALMQGQLASCRSALRALRRGGEPQPAPEAVLAALQRQLDGWRALKPDVALTCRQQGDTACQAAIAPAFWSALYNLLNNAAEAGGGKVEVEAVLEGGALQIEIINRDGCLSDAQLSRAGLAALPSAKPAGLGLGMMLSHVTLSRLGGSLSLSNQRAGGVRARLTLPLESDFSHG